MQGIQRYYAEQEKQWQAKEQQIAQERAEMQQRLKALETKDMTDAERQIYEAHELAKEERRRREAVEQRLAEVAKNQEMLFYKQHFAEKYGVPPQLLAGCQDFWEMEDVAFSYLRQSQGQAQQPGALPTQQQQPARQQSQSLSPQSKVQTGEGGRAAAYRSGEKTLKDFAAEKRALKRAGGHLT
jgi:hypothetical protein